MDCPFCGSHNVSYENGKLKCWECEMDIDLDNHYREDGDKYQVFSIFDERSRICD